jgi:transposase-like protein
MRDAEVCAEAMRLLTEEGMSYKRISETLGVPTTTIYQWISGEEVVERYRQALQVSAMSRHARALKVLEDQLDDENGWLSQGAAEKLTRLCGPMAMGGGDDKGITVRIEGLTTLGMPKRVEAGKTGAFVPDVNNLQLCPGPDAVMSAAEELDALRVYEAAGLMVDAPDGGEPAALEPPAMMGGRDKPDGRGVRRSPGSTMQETREGS